MYEDSICIRGDTYGGGEEGGRGGMTTTLSNDLAEVRVSDCSGVDVSLKVVSIGVLVGLDAFTPSIRGRESDGTF